MSLKKTRFIKGIILAPDSVALDGIEGELKVDSTDGKIKVTLKDGANPSAAREVITSSQTQSLSNKTLTSPVIDTGVSGTAIDTDGTLTANSDTLLASQKAIKTYVDATVASKDQASEISYDNTDSELTATNVQDAIDEVEGRVDTAETDILDRVTGPSSSTADAIARFDGETGKLIKNSSVTLSDAGVISNATKLEILDDSEFPNTVIQVDQTGITNVIESSSVELSSGIVLNAAGGISLNSHLLTNGKVDTTTTGADQVLDSNNFWHYQVKNSSLASISGVLAPSNASLVLLLNNTGSDVEIKNESTATSAGNRIVTGTESDLTLKNNSSILLTYSVQESRWFIVGGTGSATSSIRIVAGESISQNDAVYQSNADGLIYKASSSDRKFLGFAKKAASSTESVEIVTGGILNGFSSLDAGKLYYLTSTAGAISDIGPSANGQWVVAVGLAVSNTELVINPVASGNARLITDAVISISIANNQSSPANVTGLLLDGAVTRSFIVDYAIYRKTDTASSAVAEAGQLRGVYNTQSSTWLMSTDYSGQDSGVSFSILSSGQVQYTSSNIAGANYTGSLKCSIRKTFDI